MECTSRRFVITVEILLDLWRRDIHDGKIGPTVVQKMLEKFQFLFFFLFEIDTQRQQGLIFQSTNNILSYRYYIYSYSILLSSVSKKWIFSPRFWNRILFERFWPGKWKSAIFLPWNEIFYFQTLVSVPRPRKIRIKRNRISPIKLTYTVGVLQKRRVWRTANRFFCPIRGWKNGGIRCERSVLFPRYSWRIETARSCKCTVTVRKPYEDVIVILFRIMSRFRWRSC